MAMANSVKSAGKTARTAQLQQEEEDRLSAIQRALDRYSGGESLRQGMKFDNCGCSRNLCLTSSCKCYRAEVLCSNMCKCKGCNNCKEKLVTGYKSREEVEAEIAESEETSKDPTEEIPEQNHLGQKVPPVVFSSGTIPKEVIVATVRLLLVKGEALEKLGESSEEIERGIIDEFGDCLASIMMDLGTTVE